VIDLSARSTGTPEAASVINVRDLADEAPWSWLHAGRARPPRPRPAWRTATGLGDGRCAKPQCEMAHVILKTPPFAGEIVSPAQSMGAVCVPTWEIFDDHEGKSRTIDKRGSSFGRARGPPKPPRNLGSARLNSTRHPHADATLGEFQRLCYVDDSERLSRVSAGIRRRGDLWP